MPPRHMNSHTFFLSQLPFEREGETIIPKPFAYDNVSYSEYEAEDQAESVYGIEDEVQSDTYPYPLPTPNPRHKWSKGVTEVARDMTRDSYDMRRTRSQFQK